MWAHSKMAAATRHDKRRSLNETCLADTLILDFQISRTLRNLFLLFKPFSLWYSVMAAQADIVLNYNIHLKKYATYKFEVNNFSLDKHNHITNFKNGCYQYHRSPFHVLFQSLQYLLS